MVTHKLAYLRMWYQARTQFGQKNLMESQIYDTVNHTIILSINFTFVVFLLL